MRARRCKYAQLPDDERRRADLRRHVNALVTSGQLVRQPCEVCGGRAQPRLVSDDPRAVAWGCWRHRDEVVARARAREVG